MSRLKIYSTHKLFCLKVWSSQHDAILCLFLNSVVDFHAKSYRWLLWMPAFVPAFLVLYVTNHYILPRIEWVSIHCKHFCWKVVKYYQFFTYHTVFLLAMWSILIPEPVSLDKCFKIFAALWVIIFYRILKQRYAY